MEQQKNLNNEKKLYYKKIQEAQFMIQYAREKLNDIEDEQKRICCSLNHEKEIVYRDIYDKIWGCKICGIEF